MLNIKWKSEATVLKNKTFIVCMTGALLLLLLLLLLLMTRAHWSFKVGGLTSTEPSASLWLHIYCLKHYTVHTESDLNEHFVQYTGTFSELFMLVCVGIILIRFILVVQPCHFIIAWSIVALLYCEWESRYMFVMCVMFCKYKVYTVPS